MPETVKRAIASSPAQRLGLLFILFFAGSLALPRALLDNSGSLAVFHNHITGGPGTAFPGPRHGHPRAQIWNDLSLYRSGEIDALAGRFVDIDQIADPYSLQLAARVFEDAGDYAAAVEAWSRLGNSTELLRIAEKAAEQGDLPAAENAFENALALDPVRTTAPMSDFLVGQRDDPAAAEGLLREAVALTDNHRLTPYWLLRLVKILEEQERWDEAVEVHLAVIVKSSLMYAADQQLFRRYVDLAWAHHMACQQPGALEALEQAVRLNESAGARQEYFWVRAGQIYEWAGQGSEAQAAYTRVLEQDPENKVALEGLDRLDGREGENDE